MLPYCRSVFLNTAGVGLQSSDSVEAKKTNLSACLLYLSSSDLATVAEELNQSLDLFLTREQTVLRTHTCGELTAENVSQAATLCGWVDRIRDFGGVTFVDLRDRYGITQVVFNPAHTKAPADLIDKLRSEFVIKVEGHVGIRPDGQTNKNLATGEIEFNADHLEVLNTCETPPFVPSQKDLPGEDLRLKHRYLDLRRQKMMDTLVLRNKIIKGMRDYAAEHNFIDIETPILGRSTPEGARDYLVPSRVHNGSFYALPQSPQIYKQIMMIAGYDRYVQVARCFRDEDLRADRQPEFTQLDMEMSFVDR